MRIGCPKEIKSREYRVGLVPASVRGLVRHGHEVVIEHGAGEGIGFGDDAYQKAGARIVGEVAEIFATSEMIIKVKEPQPSEYWLLRPDQILFTYLHLAADPTQADALVRSRCIAIAYETVTGPSGFGLPLLQPMSEIAGRLSVMVGAHHLQKHLGGNGRLLSGVPGIAAGKVVVLGGGVAGMNAARVAVGMGAQVVIFERNSDRLRQLDDLFTGQAQILQSSTDAIELACQDADLIIGAVLVPGASAPRLITKGMLTTMRRGTIMVDIAIDQGGCFETSRPTTHDDPVYEVDGIIHYCVANMPGAVPLTSAMALNHAILPYVIRIADLGWKQACVRDPGLAKGLNVVQGKHVHPNVAQSLNVPLHMAEEFLGK